jgi:hypothetical protein
VAYVDTVQPNAAYAIAVETNLRSRMCMLPLYYCHGYVKYSVMLSCSFQIRTDGTNWSMWTASTSVFWKGKVSSKCF